MATITLNPIADTYTAQASPTTSYGSSIELVAGIINSKYLDAYMNFNVPAHIPAGSVINSAILKIFVTGYSGTKGFSVGALSSAMTESMTYNNAIGSSESGRVNFIPSTSYGTISINITSVINWNMNYGVEIYGNYGPSVDYRISFYSRESGVPPQLVIDFTPPNSPPYAPNLNSPVHGGWNNIGSPTVSWGFNDPDAGNYQGAWVVHILEHYSNSVVRDTGWVDGQAQSWVISPALPDGTYRYRVLTKDQSGAIGPWSWEPYFYVDTTPPTASGLDGTKYGAGGVRYHLSDVGDIMGVNKVLAYMLRNDGSNWMVYEGAAVNNGGGLWYYDFPTPSDGVQGYHLVRFHVIDNAGNYSAGYDAAYYYDTVAPVATLYAPLDGTATSGRLEFAWNYSDATPQSSYQVQIINGSYTAVIWDSGILSGAATSYLLPDIGEGIFYARLYVTDSAGNVNYPTMEATRRLYIVDRTAPTIGTLSPQQYTNGTTATVYVDGVSDSLSGISYVQVYQVRPDGTYYDIGNASLVSSGKYAIDATGIDSEGNWRFDFRIYDKAGNTAGGPGWYYSAYVMRDTSNPVVGSGDGDRYSNQATGTIRHTISNVSDATSGVISATFQFRKSLDNGLTWGAWGTVFNGTLNGTSWYYDVPISGDGYYEIAAMVFDRANNQSGYYYMHTTVDSVLANDPNPKVKYGTTTATFTWDAFSDPNPSSGRNSTDFYLYEWDGTSMGTVIHGGDDIGNVTTYTQTGLKAGQRYRYTVAYHDKAGNESSYTYKEFITKKQIGSRKIHNAGVDIMLPVYALDSGVLGSKSYRVACGGGVVGCYELVDPSDPNASSERINTPQGVKALAK
ncbi:Ig-like domain (group 3) [Paenibacillus sp. 1_12]|uniref:DNRLRE domain-containing protein n=1 Tax=Paenibacillus sp. 1_12 TaxID=1566278 RepID=UPI0008EDE30E|nr:DNRLRE domain-containing protein [Paenibacillus sp. 1_12]SFL09869.1 Ig-like domain (group 3) [Paenibacillus sp. 1_12]